MKNNSIRFAESPNLLLWTMKMFQQENFKKEKNYDGQS